MGKFEKKAGKGLNKRALTDLLVELFRNNPDWEFTLKQIYADLYLKTHPLKMLCMDILSDLVLDEYIRELSRGRYKLNNMGQTLEGIFQRKPSGRNTFLPADGSAPVSIAERNSAHALDGDRVKVALFAKRRGREKEGEVIEIIERANDTFVGTLRVEKSYAFLLTETRTLANDIFIPKSKLKNGKDGDKAVVKIVDWPEDSRNPIGQVLDILGKTGENNAEMHAILAEYGLPYKYPEAVERAADMIPDEIHPQELANREDFRGVPTFTIDPANAKDFDDALSIRPLKEGLWEVGVHIADVTYYVPEGGIIDKEAYRRATSVYLVDRTIPMLPERLCNQLCSLRPDEDKLAYSAIFHINDKAEVKNSRIARTIIRSQRRFTYDEAQEIIEGGPHPSLPDPIPSLPQGEGVDTSVIDEKNILRPSLVEGKGEGPSFKDEILTLNRLAQRLTEKRFAAGAINFDRVEVRFHIDENGKPLGVYFKESKEANKLIEEFMLLANRTVAESIGKVPKNKKAKAFVYRIHDLPDPEKLDNLKQFIARFGYKLRTGGTKGEMSKGINKLLAEVHGKAEQNLIETISLKTMQKAKYSTHNIGHYGLAFDYYTHFTSPIRRYPDMMVHRLLTRYLGGGRTVQQQKYEEMCEHSSAMEQLAASAERSSIKYKQVEFMSEHLGQVYDGVVSGVTDWGLYVEIEENKCEGMIPMRDLGDDYYEFDERNYCLVGRRTRQRISLGDKMKIRVASANLEKKQLNFAPVDDNAHSHGPRGRNRQLRGEEPDFSEEGWQ
ncbi:MAG: RNB domain-containing ribonuclease [Bacteroidaceae bacterium]|nr:RNB domain-containing ribonuclease [Bacteroidaceae bacterium]